MEVGAAGDAVADVGRHEADVGRHEVDAAARESEGPRGEEVVGGHEGDVGPLGSGRLAVDPGKVNGIEEARADAGRDEDGGDDVDHRADGEHPGYGDIAARYHRLQ